MRRFPTTLVVLVVAIFGLVAGWKMFWPAESQRYQAVTAVRNQRSIHNLNTLTYIVINVRALQRIQGGHARAPT